MLKVLHDILIVAVTNWSTVANGLQEDDTKHLLVAVCIQGKGEKPKKPVVNKSPGINDGKTYLIALIS